MNCPAFTRTPAAIPGGEPVLRRVGAVVGTGRVVVDVDVVVEPAVVALEAQHVAADARAVVDPDPADDAVDRRQLVVELGAHQIVALMAPPAGPGRAEVVGEADLLLHREVDPVPHRLVGRVGRGHRWNEGQ
jgi:hypothetical protein